ncbi:DegV family protein [Cytobacillus sp. Hz8]|uniref:DegV family protein n=1 Tax=Cytobacillus sp. Hz8 TaxID=3347168 RepID=UPI0035E165D6
MNKIKIVTDSTVDLPNELLGDYGVEIIPLSIYIDGETFTDRVDITPKEFLLKMEQANELPKSSQPPVGVFLEVYDHWAEEGYEMISIHMSGGLSGTVQAAETAAHLTKAKVTVIDSEFISKGLGFQVIEAAKMAQLGMSREEIVARVQEVKRSTRLYVVVDTLENLVKGGRIGKGKAIIGSLLHIKPIASLESGVYNPVTTVRSHTQVVKYLAKQLAEDVKGKTIRGVGIAHAEGQVLAHKLKKLITELTGYEKIDIDYTTPIVSTHTGAGAIGFMYYFD